MDFDSDAQERCHNRLGEWLRDLYGRSAVASDDHPVFTVPAGRKKVSIAVQALGDDDACLDLWTWPTDTNPVTEAAYRYMLEANAEYRFGALNLQADGSVLFEHILMEEGLTADMLERMIVMLASGADEIGDELSKRLAMP